MSMTAWTFSGLASIPLSSINRNFPFVTRIKLHVVLSGCREGFSQVVNVRINYLAVVYVCFQLIGKDIVDQTELSPTGIMKLCLT